MARFGLVAVALLALLSSASALRDISLDEILNSDGILDYLKRLIPFRRPAKTPGGEADRVKSLPGWGELDFGLYAGYITVDEDAGRALFYVFAESRSKPESDPLVLWLNGGPGCSSLGGGLMSELGPFFPTAEGTLVENEWAWNRVANMLFLESPAFVGFSYSNTSSDIVTGDERTASDGREFMWKFFERYPQFSDNAFWISGESYGGHYVPNLAYAILEGNKMHTHKKINLKGFLVGNAWTDPPSDNDGAINFWWSHALISEETALTMMAVCNLSNVGPLNTWAEGAEHMGRCNEYIMSAREEMGPINIYEVYADVCLANRASMEADQISRLLADAAPVLVAPKMIATRKEHNAALLQGRYDPCIDNEVESYLNRPDVQRALHANTTGLPWKWTDCNENIQYSRKDLFSSMLGVYHKLVADGSIRMLLYSGDVDGIVPVTGTRKWLHRLGLPITKQWRPWSSRTGQVGGYVVEHDHKLTFATVRNAGHMVPYTQPERAFWLFSRFINGKQL